MNYRRQEKSIQSATTMEGIDQISTVFYSSFPENNFSTSFYLHKRWRYVSAGLSLQGSLSDYSRIINEQKLDYDNNSLNYRVNASTLFKNLPNISAGFQQGLNYTKSSADFKNRYSRFSPYIELEYAFLNGFIFKTDYSYNYTKDHTSNRSQNFQLGNASLFYQKEGSPWGFEVRMDNIFDTQYRKSYRVDQFMVYDSRIFVQPRMALFILSYQL